MLNLWIITASSESNTGRCATGETGRKGKTMITNLQGIGSVNAKPAGEIKLNDKLMWNYGATSIVIAIVKETKSQIVIEEQYESGTYQRRLGKNRLVAIAE